MMEQELPEYRIYVDEMNGDPVAWDIKGEEQLEQRLAVIREQYPTSHTVVREVFEELRQMYPPLHPT